MDNPLRNVSRNQAIRMLQRLRQLKLLRAFPENREVGSALGTHQNETDKGEPDANEIPSHAFKFKRKICVVRFLVEESGR